MSFWRNVGQWLDNLFGGRDRPHEVDPSHVDQAIRLIQGALDDEQRERQVRKLRLSDLNETRQAELASQLRELLAKQEEKS
jgi:hypothetical protein